MRADIPLRVAGGRYGLVVARPRLYEETRVATAVRLPVSLHRRLHDAAAARKVSVNQLVTAVVADYLAAGGGAPEGDRP